MIGLLGAGKMGMSIIGGIIDAKLYSMNDIVLYDKDENHANELKKMGYNVLASELDVYKKCDILILALKPQTFPEVIEKLKGTAFSGIIITIAAGVTLSYLQRELGDYKYIRVMPSTPALIKAGVSCIARGKDLTDDEFVLGKRIFESIGIVEEVPEEMINEYMPLNGSFPAFFYTFIRDFVKSATNRGMDEQIAIKLATESAISSAKMILTANKSIDQLIIDVCSPKGTTLAGLTAFEEYDVAKAIDQCVIRCIERGKELER